MAGQKRIAQLQDSIASIESKLNSGIVSTSDDGISATFSHSHLRRRLGELQRELEQCQTEAAGTAETPRRDCLRPVRGIDC